MAQLPGIMVVSRRSHSATGLAFILACLLVAFVIFLALKTSAPETNAQNSTSNSIIAEAVTPPPSVGSNDQSPAPPGDQQDSVGGPVDGAGPAPSPPAPISDPNATALPVPDHQAFADACGQQQPDDPMQPALCECVYQRLTSYGSVDRDKSKIAYRLCRIQAITDRDGFQRDYAPAGGDRPPPADPLAPQ